MAAVLYATKNGLEIEHEWARISDQGVLFWSIITQSNITLLDGWNDYLMRGYVKIKL